MDVEAVLAQGIAHHREGRVDLAARAYKEVLLQAPDNADALHLMSALALSGGKLEVAEQLARQAVQAAPDWFAPLLALGNAQQARGDLAAAEQAFRAALDRFPQSAEAYCNLSSVLNEQSRHDEASLAAARALTLDAAMPESHNNLGNALLALDSPEEAEQCYRQAIKLRPDYAKVWFNLGAALNAQDDADGAVAAYLEALRYNSDPEWRYRLACILSRFGRNAEAEAEFRKVLAEVPDHVPALVNLANAVAWQNRHEEALTLLTDGLARLPEMPELHWNLALLLLRLGRMEESWEHYEWRWRMESFAPYRRDLGGAPWDGVAPLAGRTILVLAEQGFGDAIQFARFVPELVRRGARVILECRRGLGRLMGTLGAGIEILDGGARPDFELTVPLLSLGALLGARLDALSPAPYLSVPSGAGDFSDVAAQPGLKTGLVWAGSPTRARAGLRSLSAAQIEPLFGLDGVAFFGLQVGTQDQPRGGVYTDLAPRLTDFADTAAAIMALDVVVTVDTAVAHLAGALGKTVLIMLSTPCDGYFWMLDRPDTPWYPSARLFRQTRDGEWADVLEAVRAELQRMVTGR